MDLACLKGFVDAKSFCNCKQHEVRIRYICLEPNCEQRLSTICSICLKYEHKGHQNIEITQFYHILINEMAGESQDLSQSKDKLLEKDKIICQKMKEMDDLLFEIEILFKTVKQLYKDTKSAIDNMKELIKESPTPSQQVYQQIEQSLIGKHWKESTQKGINFRIKNIFDNIQEYDGEFQIDSNSPKLQHIANQITYFLQFYDQKLKACHLQLEQCFELANIKFKNTSCFEDQLAFANIYTEQNLITLPQNSTKIWVHYIEKQTEEYLKNLTCPQIIYFDIPGKIGQNKHSLNCIQNVTQKHGQNLQSLLLNFNSWQNITINSFQQIDNILTPCQNLKVLQLNLFKWNINNIEEVAENQDRFEIILNSIVKLRQLEALTLFLGKWNNIKNQNIIQLSDSITQFQNLESIDLQFPECNEHSVNDEALKLFASKLKLQPNLKNINLNLNCWYREGSQLTEQSLNYFLSILMVRSFNQFQLSVRGSTGVGQPYLQRLSYEIKKIKFASLVF
ncbi:hypothetical protein TTHERM_00463870 (macronuclear) [Tetrahymena thermophila SB210]|uniref:Uncharacterized protein n=1 Tax=Tetrahymena thermophila (strain SB210) TaxID=312017 RepID=Q23PP6_TETTS|nr:hypothetical protein TTHERM_00463870 [Tetrahymena thermophila SB210]EAR98639.2 hypothetical protein TTHERM_00463870 [Tetrahymena thermophila SB210]|eukprot:XP_001018884.2 hypothetical protein TTHERM_00463870 [Tetrahymena thermophila SB210]